MNNIINIVLLKLHPPIAAEEAHTDYCVQNYIVQARRGLHKTRYQLKMNINASMQHKTVTCIGMHYTFSL